MPHIALIDSTNKFYNVVYEEDEKRRNYKVLAYLNQTGLIDYTQEKFCENGRPMTIKKVLRQMDGAGDVRLNFFKFYYWFSISHLNF